MPMPTKQNRHGVNTRFACRQDLHEIAAIEAESFEDPWTEADFIRYFTGRNQVGEVAESRMGVVGFIAYDLQPTEVWIVNMAVAKDMRRQGVGADMIEHLKERMSKGKRKRIVASITDENLKAHLFFKSLGFVAVGVVRGGNSEPDEYVMELRI